MRTPPRELSWRAGRSPPPRRPATRLRASSAGERGSFWSAPRMATSRSNEMNQHYVRQLIKGHRIEVNGEATHAAGGAPDRRRRTACEVAHARTAGGPDEAP